MELLKNRLEEAETTLNLLVYEVFADIEPNSAAAEDTLDLKNTLETIMCCLKQTKEILNLFCPAPDVLAPWPYLSYSRRTQKTSKPGRPSFVVEEEQIEFLRKLHLPWVKTSQLLGISKNTLGRKRAAYGIGSATGDPD